MKKIYVILSNSGTRVSKFFHFFTKAKYTHASICFSKDLNTFYSFARWNIKLPIFAGIAKEHPNEGVFALYKPTCIIYELEVTDEQYASMKKEIKHMLDNHKNYTYNFLGCPLIYLGIPLDRKTKFTCTQFVAYILSKNEVKIPVKWELCQPQHLLGVGNKIYEGYLNNIKISL